MNGNMNIKFTDGFKFTNSLKPRRRFSI